MIFQICLLFYAVACYTTKALVIERTARVSVRLVFDEIWLSMMFGYRKVRK